jgi:hypothetical protein
MATNWTNRKAWLLGAGILVAGHLLWWGVAAAIPLGESLRVALFFVPSVAAFLVTYYSPRYKLAMGMSMGVVGAGVGFLATVIYESAGYHIDKIGGPAATLAVLLMFHLAYALAGTAAGYAAWRIRTRAGQSSTTSDSRDAGHDLSDG